eukprot:5639643-Amphidinium_carterae.1
MQPLGCSVAQETWWRSGHMDAATTFAATLSLGALKALISLWQSGPSDYSSSTQGHEVQEERVLSMYDVSRAHFHSAVRRIAYIKVPTEEAVRTLHVPVGSPDSNGPCTARGMQVHVSMPSQRSAWSSYAL